MVVKQDLLSRSKITEFLAIPIKPATPGMNKQPASPGKTGRKKCAPATSQSVKLIEQYRDYA
jgi:hypothetical protein